MSDSSYYLPGTRDSPYFVSGGISIRPPKDVIWRPESKTEPQPWTCSYCGTLNPPNTWKCTRCPAPRTEEATERRSTWSPPVRVESHMENDLYIAPSPLKSRAPSKPPVPILLALVTVFIFVGCVCGILAFFINMITRPGLTLEIILSLVLSTGLFYVYDRLRSMIRRRYDWRKVG